MSTETARTISPRSVFEISQEQTRTSISREAESAQSCSSLIRCSNNTYHRFAWLVPKFTTDPSRAATSFDVLIQSFEDPKLSDLAKGAGGDFRYVAPRADRKVSEKIISVAIFRSDKPITRPPAGWTGYAINDLNKARKKGCGGLYLVWKTTNVNSW